VKPSKNGNIQISVQCLPSLKKEIKAYAKKRTQEELKKEQTKK